MTRRRPAPAALALCLCFLCCFIFLLALAAHRRGPGRLRQRARHDHRRVGRRAARRQRDHHEQGSQHRRTPSSPMRTASTARSGCCRASTRSRPTCKASSRRSCRNVVVGVDAQANADFSLSPGAVSESVEVTAMSPLLKTDRADVATTFESKQITDLPVLDRNFTKFILLTPGTQQQQWGHAASENPQGSTQTVVNGQSFSGTSYQLDGTDNRDPILGIIVINPTLESIGETKITSQNYDAEFGQAVAGRRVGADQVGRQHVPRQRLRVLPERPLPVAQPVHAVAAERARPASSCPTRRRTSSAARWAARSSRTGCSSSATIRARRNTEGGSRLLTVPTAAARAAATSAPTASTSTIRSPACRPVRTQFAGNVIPTNRLSPQAQAILALIPLPNAPGATTARATTTSRPTRRRSTRTRSTSASTAVSATARTRSAATAGASSCATVRRRFGAGGGQRAGQPGRRLRRQEPEPRVRHRPRVVELAAGRLPVRLLPLQRQRAAVRLRHDAGGRRRDSRPQSRQRPSRSGLPAGDSIATATAASTSAPASTSTAATARSSRTSTSSSWSATSRSWSAATPSRPALDVRRAHNLRVPSDAHRSGRADVLARPDARRGRRPRPGDVPARRRDAASPATSAPSTDAREQQWRHFYYAQDTWRAQREADAELRRAARHHQPADGQRGRQRRLPRPDHRARSSWPASAASG